MNIVCFAQSTIPWPMLVVYTGNTNRIPTMQWLMLGRSSVEEQFFVVVHFGPKRYAPIVYSTRLSSLSGTTTSCISKKKKRVA